jgi:hypothetical protein
MIEIEENVPIPRSRWGKYSSIAHKMKAGDSVLCETKRKKNALRGAIYQCEGYKAVIRKQLDGTWRVWKHE